MPGKSELMDIDEAVKKVLEASPQRKFGESVELAVNLVGVDLSKPQNRLDEEVLLPHGTGREPRLAVFGRGEFAIKAEKAGAAVIAPEQIDALGKDKKAARKLVQKFDAFAAEAPLMPSIGKSLGPILGPRGMMPVPVPAGGDVTAVLGKMRRAIRVRTKDRPTFHVPVGIRTMKPEQIATNLRAVLERVEGKLERGGQNIRSAYLKTTMGPPVRVK
ncbi:MAG: 50S ribosomal protein L1 [Halobacteria archaeon]